MLLHEYVLDLLIGKEVAEVPALVLDRMSVKVMSSDCLAPQCGYGDCGCVPNSGTRWWSQFSSPRDLPSRSTSCKILLFCLNVQQSINNLIWFILILTNLMQ